MTPRKDDHIELIASSGFMTILKKLMPWLLSGGILTGSGVAVANDRSDFNSRLSNVEEAVNNNTIELNGTTIRMNQYDARILEVMDDLKTTRNDVKQILIILTKR